MQCSSCLLASYMTKETIILPFLYPVVVVYQKKADLKGSTVYTTLYPSNICAQCIRDAGIIEVVYISDKFHDAKFVEATRRILEGINCR